MVASLLLFCVPASAGPSVHLLDAGAEPRAPLRFEVPQGHTSTVDIRMATSMDIGMGGAMSMPPMRLTLRFEALEARGDGVRYRFEIVDAGVDGGDPMIRDALLDALKPMIGLRGEATVDELGSTTGLDVTPPPGVPPELASNLDRGLTMVAAPLPVEPVGVGARWTIEQQVHQQGLTVAQTTTWTLASRDGSVAVLDTAVHQTAPPQTLQDPSLPPGSQVQLASFESKGTGRTEIDLRSLVPRSAITKMDLAMRMEANVEGLTLPMDMNLGVEMTLARRANPAR